MTENQKDAHARVSFTEADLNTMAEAVKKAEANTSGEIRVVIRKSYDPGVSDISTQALRDFEDYGVGKTRDGSGVLILILTEERRFSILADYGIHKNLPQPYWDRLAVLLSHCFRISDFVNGVCAVVADVGLGLAEYFPRSADDVNELPNSVVVENA